MKATKKKFIAQSTAETLEKYFIENIQNIVEATGLELKAVSVGGKFNREGILLELGFLPSTATLEDCKAFVADRHIDDHDAALVEQKETKHAKIARVTGLKEDVVKTIASDLPKKFKCGQKFDGNKGTYTLIGFSKKKDAFILYDFNAKRVLVVDKAKFKKLKPQ